jgi:type I restriction enzyme S subunit
MKAIHQLLTEHIDIWTAADTEKKSGRGRSSGNATSVYGIKKLRELILELAVRGKLVPQDPSDEPASELLKHIQAEKAKLIAEGKIKNSKSLPQITEKEKPFELPITWEWARLGFIGYTQTGATPSKSNSDSFGSDIPFVKPGDIYPNHVEYSNEGLSFYGAEQSGRIAQSGSLLMVCIGTIGKCNLIEKTCSFNQQINSVTPYIFDSSYLLSVCRSVYFYTEAWSRSSSTTIAILNKGNWEEICIPIPPIEEQHRIVAKVDELMALCDQLEIQHSNAAEAHEKLVSHLLGILTQSQSAEDFSVNWQRLAAHFGILFTTEASIDALKQTLLQLAVMGKLVPQDANDEPASELLKRIQAEKAKLIAEGKIKKDKPLVAIAENEKPFELPEGWEWARMINCAKQITDGEHLTPQRTTDVTKIPLVTAKNVRDGNMDYTSTDYVDFDVAEKCWNRCKPELNDILIVSVGATIGRLTIIDDHRDMVIVRSVTLVKPLLINIPYLALSLRSPFLQKIIWSGVRQNAQPCLYLSVSNSLPIPLPPFAEQHRIVAKVDELMALCDALRTRINEAQRIQIHLADSIVNQALA